MRAFSVFQIWLWFEYHCFKLFGSIAMTSLLIVTCCHLLAFLISHLYYLFVFLNHLKYQYSTFYIYIKILCICNCSLNAFISCIKQCCKHIYLPLQMQIMCFLCIAKMNFIDTDLICLVTAQMSYYSNLLIICKNLTQNIMHTFKNPYKHWKISILISVNWPHKIWRISKTLEASCPQYFLKG